MLPAFMYFISPHCSAGVYVNITEKFSAGKYLGSCTWQENTSGKAQNVVKSNSNSFY
jgi:hypothetical protein